MQRLEVEDQIEFTDILEQTVKCFDKDLNEIKEGKRRLGRGADDDEVEGCIVSVCD